MIPGHFYGPTWWMMLLGGILMLLFWAGVIIFAVVAVRAILRSSGADRSTGNTSGRTPSSAMDILNERYAHGEINREEYLAMKRDLEG